MNRISLFLISCLICIAGAYAKVVPRYKAHIILKYVVAKGDSLLKNGLHEIEIPFYEESEMRSICKGKDEEFAVKILGRPIWKSGKIDHDFIVHFYHKKTYSDKWNRVSEIEIPMWQFSNPKSDSIKNRIAKKSWSSNGEFNYGYGIQIELLQNEYEVEADSLFLFDFRMNIESLRIKGQNIKLKDGPFEFHKKQRAEILIGEMNKKPVSIFFEINKGTANSIDEYEILFYLSYFENKADKPTKEYITTQYAKLLQATDFQKYSFNNSRFEETISLEYKILIY